MIIEPQASSPEINIQLTFRAKVYNSNKSKAIELTEDRVKQRIQTVLYPLTAIDKQWDLVWYVTPQHDVEPLMEVTLDDLQ